MKKKYQTVYITIKGKTYNFTGKAIPHKTGAIDGIKFSEPKELPNDYTFEEIPQMKGTLDALNNLSIKK